MQGAVTVSMAAAPEVIWNLIVDVTESFRPNQSPVIALYSVVGGQLRRRRNVRDMRTILERISLAAEAGARP